MPRLIVTIYQIWTIFLIFNSKWDKIVGCLFEQMKKCGRRYVTLLFPMTVTVWASPIHNRYGSQLQGCMNDFQLAKEWQNIRCLPEIGCPQEGFWLNNKKGDHLHHGSVVCIIATLPTLSCIACIVKMLTALLQYCMHCNNARHWTVPTFAHVHYANHVFVKWFPQWWCVMIMCVVWHVDYFCTVIYTCIASGNK